jgi:hypothetical protein
MALPRIGVWWSDVVTLVVLGGGPRDSNRSKRKKSFSKTYAGSGAAAGAIGGAVPDVVVAIDSTVPSLW